MDETQLRAQSVNHTTKPPSRFHFKCLKNLKHSFRLAHTFGSQEVEHSMDVDLFLKHDSVNHWKERRKGKFKKRYVPYFSLTGLLRLAAVTKVSICFP
jgi:hypothetical protein